MVVLVRVLTGNHVQPCRSDNACFLVYRIMRPVMAIHAQSRAQKMLHRGEPSTS